MEQAETIVLRFITSEHVTIGTYTAAVAGTTTLQYNYHAKEHAESDAVGVQTQKLNI